MAEIISIDEKKKRIEAQKAAAVRKHKIMAVQKVFQCTRCAFKCEKCGMQISVAGQEQKHDFEQSQTPFRLCKSCEEEYNDFIKRLKGGGDPDCYWHNDDWLRAWKAWIDYQGAIGSYLKSKEFRQILRELKLTTSE